MQQTIEQTKKMPGFSRYLFHRDGKVTNIATGSEIKPIRTPLMNTYNLTDDKGKRVPIGCNVFEKLFPEPLPIDRPKKKKFSYADAIEMRRYINQYGKQSWTMLGKLYNVHRSTIERIMNEKAYPTKPHDVDYVKGKTDKRS
jgi:hypothetical protein